MDFLELYRRYGCTMQIGGSDQWGNLVAGVGLIRSVEGASVHALATPLITKPDGTKYGKSEGGAIWLSPDLMSPYAFYQFWLNVERRRGAEPAARVQLQIARGDRGSWRGRAPSVPPPARASVPWPRSSPRWSTAREETRRAIAASQALFGQGELAELDERTLAAAVAELRPHQPRRATPAHCRRWRT